MKRIARLAVLVALLVGPAGLDGQTPDRRERLEAQVRSRFLDLAGERLALTPAQRERLAGVLDEGADARRRLVRESVELRRRLMAAARDTTTPSATFEDILRRMVDLSDREHALQRREQERLAAFLTPRQQALFLMMRMRFNEQVRDVRGRGPPPRR